MTATAKDIRVLPIDRSDADACVRAWHYSGKPYVKSRVHAGVFLGGRLLGAIQLGPGIDTRKLIASVPGTAWDGYLEINRMALSDELPPMSESRALGVIFRMIRKYAPWIDWVVSFSDATQCGDGAIYRAAGMMLTGIRENETLWQDRHGAVVSSVGIRTSARLQSAYGLHSRSGKKDFVRAGLSRLSGFQLRYHWPKDDRIREKIKPMSIRYDMIPDDARMKRGVRMYPACPLVEGSAAPPQKGVRPDRHAPTFSAALFDGIEPDWKSALFSLPRRIEDAGMQREIQVSDRQLTIW